MKVDPLRAAATLAGFVLAAGMILGLVPGLTFSAWVWVMTP